MSEERGYALELDEGEIERHRLRPGGCLFLAERLAGAGLEVLEFRGRYVITQTPPQVRPPPWAARDAMVEAGMATAEDMARWDRAFQQVAAAPDPPTLFIPLFYAVGRRPG